MEYKFKKKSHRMLYIEYINSKSGERIRLPISIFARPKDGSDYAILQGFLDKLIDEVKEDESHPLALAMQILGDNLEEYDNLNFPDIGDDIAPVDVVKYLMKVNNLKQKDLIDIFGNQGNVSKFLNGQRELSKAQILGLKKRFGVSSDHFI